MSALAPIPTWKGRSPTFPSTAAALRTVEASDPEFRLRAPTARDVRRLFSVMKLDTYDIGKQVGLPEHEVLKMLRTPDASEPGARR